MFANFIFIAVCISLWIPLTPVILFQKMIINLRLKCNVFGLPQAYQNIWFFPNSPCDRPRVIESLRGREVVDVAAGGAHSACITASGELYTWGKGRYGRLGHGDSEDQPRPKLVSGCGVANWPHELVHIITYELLVEQCSILWVSITVDLFSNCRV